MPQTRRLFFALWPTEGLRTQVAERSAAAIEHIPCRPMSPGNLHVTLAFIGSVPVDRVATLIELGHRVTLAPTQLILDQLAIWKQARVLVLTASCVPPQLLQLVGELQARLNAAGFKLDERPYRPHVTLAREVRAADSSETHHAACLAGAGFRAGGIGVDGSWCAVPGASDIRLTLQKPIKLFLMKYC